MTRPIIPARLASKEEDGGLEGFPKAPKGLQTVSLMGPGCPRQTAAAVGLVLLVKKCHYPWEAR